MDDVAYDNISKESSGLYVQSIYSFERTRDVTAG